MSIYAFLKDKSAEEIAADGFRLPDSGDLHLRPGEAWVPGAFEGILLRTDTRIKQHVIVNYQVAGAVKRQALHPSKAHEAKLKKLLTKYSAISLADPLCSICYALKLEGTTEKKAALRRLALDLALHEDKREPVKIGIALLGICGKPEDLELIEPMGLHDEFTLYVAGTAVRLLNAAARNDYLLSLAEKVRGWGKISILYELDYTDPAIRLWAVKRGCANTVGLSYLSNVCATKGKMAEILSQMLENKFSAAEEQALFSGICDIFTGLLQPEENNDGLSEYAQARTAAESFTALCEKKPELAASDSRSEEIRDGLKFIL
ncbi:MAG: hypothetical protein ACLSVG_01240 [Clostridia bacterium]